ncbi:TetR family transcriptional regulator [Fluviicoccus keumensis]|uniref:TetR family transcriptional regulator n=1 Tax=Fluviicoccus keumensis TaxID=1435465 RepID=A0A4V2G6B9_9GAMM|nr:TetR/AcrR family transcriptional regulator [Fluviicoccus keumensis]RZU48036.1 TetR family transcriptional regulator [Fluviicoccus keumensis]
MPRVNRLKTDRPPPQQRVQPVQARSRQKIDAILDATAGLLREHGVEAVTILAIAARAGVPPATVYHYFENRLAIFAALAKRIMDAVDAELLAVLAEKLEAAAPDFRTILQGLFDAYAQAPGYVPVLGAMRAEPALQALVRESNQRSAVFIAGLLQHRTRLPPERAQRIAWIISEECETVLQEALTSLPDQARALLDEKAEMVEVLFRHYARP